MSIFKRLFCKHRFRPYQYYDERTADGKYQRRHIWKCVKCGKVQRNAKC